MRIAISGTHCSGKSTLIDAFLEAHPDYTHEPEPYTVLVEDYGEEFSTEPCVDDFLRQLEFNVERLRQYQPGDRVIFERCPVDFLAYILALKELHREEVHSALLDQVSQMVTSAIQSLDAIVFLPLDDADGIDLPDEEDPELREAVNHRLSPIYGDDVLGLFGAGCPHVLEARATVAERLQVRESAVRL
jgi:predicted ATPase